jgi:hypothetical protein
MIQESSVADPIPSEYLPSRLRALMHLAGWCNRAGLVESAVLPLANYDNILGIGEIGHRGPIFRPSCTSAELGNLIKHLQVRPPDV